MALATWLLLALAALAVLVLAVRTGPTSPAARTPSAPPCAWVINLRRNRDRLAAFEKSYAASDLATAVQLRRLDAVDGKEVEFEECVHPEALRKLREQMRSGERQGHEDLTAGAVGCYLSHVEAWRRIADSGAPWGLVFEDDALVNRDAWARLEAVLARDGWGDAGQDAWDLIFLGTQDRTEAPVEPGVPPGLVKLSFVLGLFAYAVSARAARRLVDSALPVRRQVDWELTKRDLRVYCLNPPVAAHNYMGTDIQSPLAKKEGDDD